jgi:hypothetical protein
MGELPKLPIGYETWIEACILHPLIGEIAQAAALAELSDLLRYKRAWDVVVEMSPPLGATLLKAAMREVGVDRS